MASRSWIIPFPEGYHGRDNRPWLGLIPCHDDDCNEWQIVRRKTNGEYYASCDKKHPQIRLGGCGAKYGWGAQVTMPPQTLDTLKANLNATDDMPREYLAVLADAWGLTVDQLINGDFDHGRTEEADQDQEPADAAQGEGVPAEFEPEDDVQDPWQSPECYKPDAAEIAGDAEGSPGNSEGDGGGAPGGPQHFQGAAPEGSGGGGASASADTVESGGAGIDQDGLAPAHEPDDDGASAGPGERTPWDDYRRLYGGHEGD